MTRDELWLLREKYDGVMTPAFEADRHRLASGEPVAYVIGHQPFLGLTIYLDSHPLIPRPETEWWTEQMLQSELGGKKLGVRRGRAARSNQFSLPVTGLRKMEVPLWCAPHFGPASERLNFLDLCAGSGAIGCAALKTLRNAHIYFGEIDSAHEATIEKNIRVNNLDASRAHIGLGDLFTPFADMKFDIIAVNPPYLPVSRELDPSVTDYEPALALRSGTNGLDLIRRIAAELPQHLTPNGVAWIECDSAHAVAACALFADQNMTSTIRTDQYSAPRVLVVSFP